MNGVFVIIHPFFGMLKILMVFFLQKGPTNQQLGLNKRQGQVQSEMVHHMLTTRRLLKGLIQTTDFFKERFKKKKTMEKKSAHVSATTPVVSSCWSLRPSSLVLFTQCLVHFQKLLSKKKQKCFHTIWMFQKIGGFSPQIIPF